MSGPAPEPSSRSVEETGPDPARLDQRGSLRVFVFTNVRAGEGVSQVVDFLRAAGGLG